MSAGNLQVTPLVNDGLGVRVVEFLLQDSEIHVDRVVVNDLPKRRLPATLAELSSAWGVPVVSYAEARFADSTDIAMPSMGVSVLFGHILKSPEIASFSQGVINCHPSLLPHNRGAFPAAWSILEGSPAGATIHVIDTGLDTGSTLLQRQVEVRDNDTSGSLYERTLDELFELFESNWASLKSGNIAAVDQAAGGSYHSSADFHAMRNFTLDQVTSAEDLLRRLRASSLLDGSGARITQPSGGTVEIAVRFLSSE